MERDRNPESSESEAQDETEYLLRSPAMRARLLSSMETHRASVVQRLRDFEAMLVEHANEAGTPIELHSPSGVRAWVLLEKLWNRSSAAASDPHAQGQTGPRNDDDSTSHTSD